MYGGIIMFKDNHSRLIGGIVLIISLGYGGICWFASSGSTNKTELVEDVVITKKKTRSSKGQIKEKKTRRSKQTSVEIKSSKKKTRSKDKKVTSRKKRRSNRKDDIKRKDKKMPPAA